MCVCPLESFGCAWLHKNDRLPLMYGAASPNAQLGMWFMQFFGVGKESYLVDPASSHMLVSKIKPCMCEYELIQTVKLRMAH